jgi:acidic leucine-rich nuclear phosphoprotein 32 family protein B
MLYLTKAVLAQLEVLDLTDCPICKIKDYREQVFKILPNLKILDMRYQDGTLYESEGKFYMILAENEDFENGSEDDFEDEDFLDEEGESQFEDEEDEEEDEDYEKNRRKKQKTDE